MVAFLWLFCTMVAIPSQSLQSVWALLMVRQRYCSTHWFVHSDSLSVWGWNTEDMFCLIPSCWARAFAKRDVNRGSLSDMTLLGRPNHW
jgi:hypothetical protein